VYQVRFQYNDIPNFILIQIAMGMNFEILRPSGDALE
jgi:hypothetical protein